MGLLQGLDIGRDLERPDRRQRQSALLTPGKERRAGSRIGAPGVRIADRGGEEFDIAPAGGFAGVGNQRRDQGGGVMVHGARRCGRPDGWKLVGSVGHVTPTLTHISRMINDVIIHDMGNACTD
jgi:hypothetical protein